MDTYKDVFTHIGTFPGDPYKFQLKSNAKPAKHAPRKVPIHLKDAFHEEVDKLVKWGILEKVELPMEWVNPYIIVEKESSWTVEILIHPTIPFPRSWDYALTQGI